MKKVPTQCALILQIDLKIKWLSTITQKKKKKNWNWKRKTTEQ